MNKFVTNAVLSALGIAVSAGAFANTTYTWAFNTPAGAVSGPHSYLDSVTTTYSIVAAGYKTANAASNAAALGSTWGDGASYTYNSGAISSNKLYGKTSSADESGLGLSGTSSDNEIVAKSFVQLDVQNLYDHHLQNLTMHIASIQSGEGYMLWGSNVAGVAGTLLAVGKNPNNGGTVQSLLVPDFGSYRYFSVSGLARSSGSSDVLIQNGVTAQSVPEPTSLVLLASGGLALLKCRKRG